MINTNRKIEFWIITSTEDEASMNIRNYLLEKYCFIHCKEKWENNSTYILDINSLQKRNINDFSDFFNIRLVLTDKRMIFLDEDFDDQHIQQQKFGDFLIFASRHRSESGIPAFLTHAPGNWSSNNSYGGRPNSLSHTSAFLLKYAYKNLSKQKAVKKLDWAVDLEVDHHGPTEIQKPIIFMELGSSLLNWQDKKGASVVGDAIIDTIYDYLKLIFQSLDIKILLKEETSILKSQIYKIINKKLKSKDLIIGIGFGGPHYARNFSKIYQKNDSVFISHIIPKYHILQINEEHIRKMIETTIEPINTAILDWKGINSLEKKHIIKLLKKFDIKIKKTKELH